MYVYVLLLTSMTRVTGLVTITADTTEYVIDGNVGRNVTLKCHIDNLHKPITWMHSRVARPLSNCDDNNDNCNPGSVLNYIFSSNFTNMNYFLLIQNINWTNEGNFTCEQGDGSYATTSFAIKAVLPLYPPSISETSGEGTYMLETTTECIYPIAEISVRWYVRNANNTTKEYSRISATRSENKTACDIYNTGQVTSSITIKKSTSHTNTVKFFVIISLDGKDWKSLDTQDDYDIEDGTASTPDPRRWSLVCILLTSGGAIFVVIITVLITLYVRYRHRGKSVPTVHPDNTSQTTSELVAEISCQSNKTTETATSDTVVLMSRRLPPIPAETLPSSTSYIISVKEQENNIPVNLNINADNESMCTKTSRNNKKDKKKTHKKERKRTREYKTIESKDEPIKCNNQIHEYDNA